MGTKRHRGTSPGVKNAPDRPAAAPATAPDQDRPPYEPRTPLGRRLAQIRRRIVESGEPLLDWNGLEREIADRRGEGER